ncbi:MAG: hypothetical protein DRN06_00400 [Thermoprotei archaeon]|nr:MAG: hypothetical protein DRN06_00400 [Thermoprotei archaeon]
MKILLVSERYPLIIGGVEEHIRGLAERLEEKGFEVSVAYRRRQEKSLVNAPRLKCLKVSLDTFKLRDFIKQEAPDLIHAHYSFNWLPPLLLAIGSQLNIPGIVTSHSALPGYEYDPVRYLYALMPHRLLLSKAQVMISVSRAVDHLMAALVNKRVRRVIIPNAVDTNKYRPSHREPSDPLVLYVGRLIYRKGIHVLLHAFKKVIKEEREAKLVIAGSGYMEPFFKALASSLKLRGYVEFRGNVSDEVKAEFYRRAWLTVVPTLYGEGFGIVAIESMASGTPVVASEVGGLKEVVDNEVSGLLVKPNSPKKLAEAVIALLQDPVLRKRLSVNARLKALKEYAWDSVASQIIDIYSEAHRESARPR